MKREQYDSNIKCLQCNNLLATYNLELDTHNPSPDKLLEDKNVAVPNLGWFCSQKCGNEFEIENKMQFQRDENNDIRYY